MPRGRPRGSVATPNKPRGRMTAYAFFLQTCREEHKKLYPDENVEFGLFSKQCSDRWKKMSVNEKGKFHEMANKDKLRYMEEMKNYVGPPTGKRRRARAKKMKDPNKPKRALSAFFFYANDERPKVRAANPDFSVGEVAKELGRQWSELNEGEKAPYEKMAQDDRVRYDQEMTAYRSGNTMEMPKAQTNGHSEAKMEEDPEDESEEEEDEEDDEDEASD